VSGAEDFLVEIGTEELPPKALRNLMNSFAAGIESGLEKARLGHGEVKAFASPRRLAVVVSNLDAGQEDRDTVQKGPPIAIAFDNKGKPTKAGLAFAKKCGVDINELGREKNAGGEWLVHKAVQAGQVAATLLPGIVQQALDSLPVPRRMRWGDHDDEFVRPVHWLIMLHGSTVVPGAVLGIESGNQTCGHRFHSSGKIEIGAPGEYATTLESAGYVLADFADRREKIVAAVFAAAKKAGGEPVCDEALFDEVTALTEWPVPLTGTFDKEFLALPKEVIIATLTSHQRYFPVASKKGDLLPVFITLANIESKQPAHGRTQESCVSKGSWFAA